MGLHHRKMVSDYDCGFICNDDDCLKDCKSNYYKYNPLPPSPPIYSEVDVNKHSKHTTISTYLIITFAIVATAFFLVCCYAIYAKFFRSRRRILSQQQTQENHDELFLDEEHGPMVDHPIWYIRTTGLDQSIITAITVCKYKRGEGLIEGTDCSVCLNEFEEDESLRLLPKCNHAFHLPCIDTWLRSHTNCPMCRAPVVTNPARIPSMQPNVVDSSSMENSHMESLENSGGGGGGGSGMENSDDMLRNGAEEEVEVEVEVEDGRRVCEGETESLASEVVDMQPRRSVSLDSSSAAKINLALATVVSVESHGNENLATSAKGSSSFRTRYLQSEPSSMKRSRSFNGKHLLSRYSRSHKKPNAPVRSF